MKTKFILGSLALAATFVGCSNEELNNVASNEIQSNMIKLGDNFMIGAVSGNGIDSRTHWELAEVEGVKVLRNVFAPVVGTTNANNAIGTSTSVIAPTIGLCWIGQSLGTDVYTNYEFIHNGWLADGADEAVFEACEGKLLTGWTYSEMGTTASTNGQEVYDNVTLNPTTKANIVEGEDNYDAINYNSGVFKTENKSIFGGQYIAYYPYNKDFVEAGTIPAVSKVEFTAAENNLNSMDIAENTFRYTDVATIEGGAKAEGFSFNNLSGVLRISLQNIGGSNTIDVENVMLYSASAGFLKEVRLSASAIAAGKTGTELYSEVVEKSKTIMVNAETKFGVAHSEGTIDSHAIYITALPTTVSDLKVLLFDQGSGTWAEYAIGELVIPAGGSKGITLTVKDTDFKAVSYASNSATLTAALVTGGTEATPKTVKVLGDIVLDDNMTVPGYVTVEGDKIIVPEYYQLAVLENGVVKSTIEVEGESCCSGSDRAGLLFAGNGSTIDGEVYIRAGVGDNKKNGAMAMKGVTLTENSKVVIEGEALSTGNSNVIKGQMTVASNARLTLNLGEMNFKGATLVNNGTIEVKEDCKFDVMTATGSSTLAAGQNFTNNGKFIDNIGANIGAATQGMINNGDYICKVAEQTRLAEAYANKTACNIIEFVNDNKVKYNLGVAVKHNDEDVDLVVAEGKHVEIETLNGVDPTLGNIDVNGALEVVTSTVRANTTDYGVFTVAGDINVNKGGSIALAEDVRDMKAKNLYVNKGASAKFENRNAFTGKTLAVSGTIEVKKDGKFTITAADDGKNIAYVTCTELVEGGTFSGKPVLVAAN